MDPAVGIHDVQHNRIASMMCSTTGCEAVSCVSHVNVAEKLGAHALQSGAAVAAATTQ
jgi:hypothetical protein